MLPLLVVVVVVVVDANEHPRRRRTPSARGCCRETREELHNSALIMFLRPAGRHAGLDLGAAQDETLDLCSLSVRSLFLSGVSSPVRR